MSNFNAIHRGYIGAVVEPFLPGRAANVIPIAYEALTPDTFVFLFTLREDDTDKYYVAYEVDYVSGIDEVRGDIENWSGTTIIDMLRPTHKSQVKDDPSVYIDNVYKVYMCQIEKPRRTYWEGILDEH
jgi:hypothetical protein